MRKRCNYEPTSYEPPEKRPATTIASPTADIKPSMILIDILGKKWRLGKTVGTGGFGEIYLASDDISHDVKTDAQYVAKVESHTSGPLFVEIHCYLRIARPETINEWKENNKMQQLGMPHYVASGSHKIGGTKYRFLILPRFEKDLEEVFEAKKRKFNLKTVLTIALQTIDVLQYIHSKGYIHSDIKASNILFNQNRTKGKQQVTTPTTKAFIRYHGCTPIRTCKVRKLQRVLRPNLNLRSLSENQEAKETSVSKIKKDDVDKIYLLDYGLASKYVTSDGEHKQFCTDERKAHAGTILFCSRDAHAGAQSRRSDLECLGYNMIYWLTSNLPWSENTDDAEVVHRKKRKCIENVKEFLDFSFNYQCPRFLYDYFHYLQNLEFEEEPDYNYLKTLFQDALREYGYKDNLLLDFDNLEGWGRKQKKIRRNSENFKVKRAVQKWKRSPLKSNLPIKPILRKQLKNKKLKRKMNWSKILMDPEVIMKMAKSRERKMTETSDSVPAPTGILNLDLSSLNPTTAMKDVFNKSMERHNCTGGASPRYRGDTTLDNIEGYTPAMMEVYNRKKEREELEYEQLFLMNSKSHTRANRKTKAKTTNKSKKRTGRSTARKRKILDSPPCTRLTKAQSGNAAAKKEVLRQPKALPIRRTYSLRG